MRIEKVVRETRAAQHEQGRAEAKAAADEAMAAQVETDANGAKRRATEAEIKKVTAEQALQNAKRQLEETAEVMKAKLQEIRDRTQAEERKTEEARQEALGQRKLADAEEAGAHRLQQNQTQMEGTLAIARVKERSAVEMAEAAVAAARTRARIQVETSNTSMQHEVNQAAQTAQVNLELLKLQHDAKLRSARQGAEANISHADFDAAQTINGLHVEEQQAEARTAEAERDLVAAQRQVADAKQETEEDEAKLRELSDLNLPTMDELDPDGEGWTQPGMVNTTISVDDLRPGAEFTTSH